MSKLIQPIVYCTDIHYGAAPVCRKDNYNSAILRKFKFCLALASKKNAILLVGGDLFDKPNQNFYDLILLMDLFKQYPNVRVIVNRGNASHDGNLENSPLTLLERGGIIETSDGRDYVDLAGVRIIFAPNHIHPMTRDSFINPHSQNYLMTHHLIVKEPAIFDHYLIEDFVTECDVVFCADYHPYQGIVKSNNTVFIAPGSIARRKNTKDNLEKEPKCVYLDHKGINVVDIPYDEDVWVEKADKEDVQANELDLGELSLEINSFDENMSLEAMWADFVQKKNINEDICNYIKNRVFGEF